ncbi:MAG: very short patch repair endonuclease [Ignavibacteria bacterium]|nr:very short patch repair endonuclease [Ignavibacteria bacterium]
MRKPGPHAKKAPSFHGYKPASRISSAIKRANRSRNTRHELILSRELRRLGLRFTRNDVSLPGKPDIVFLSARLLVFSDGDFWHGRSWRDLRTKLARGSNADYWIAKIQSNILRDIRIRRKLSRLGWRVLRVWEKDINRDPKEVAMKIASALSRRPSGTYQKHNADHQHMGCK